MNSRPQSHGQTPAKSSANASQNSSVRSQPSLNFAPSDVRSGSFDDSSLVRGVLIQSIKNSGKTRAAIAEEMESLLARTVTEKMLNAFTAESRNDRRWPAEFDRAFCMATGDDALLSCRAELAGLHVITAEEKDLMELGRQYLLRNQADEQIALLQRRMHGRVS